MLARSVDHFLERAAAVKTVAVLFCDNEDRNDEARLTRPSFHRKHAVPVSNIKNLKENKRRPSHSGST